MKNQETSASATISIIALMGMVISIVIKSMLWLVFCGFVGVMFVINLLIMNLEVVIHYIKSKKQ